MRLRGAFLPSAHRRLAAVIGFLACVSCAHGPKFQTPREARIHEYLRSYPDTGAGRLDLMRRGYIFKGMSLAQFQAVVGFRPAEEITLEASPRHILSLGYRAPGDESVSQKDIFIFLNGALYSWDIKSFKPDPDETPLVEREYAGQK